MSDGPFRAPVSASSLFRRKLCPGSANAEMGLPDLREESAATQGTLLHSMEEDESLSREELSATQVRALEKNRRLTDLFLKSVMEREGVPEDDKPLQYREKEFFLCRWREMKDGAPMLEEVYPHVPGHTDIIYHWPNRSLVLVGDSKFGVHKVENADVNLQLRMYAVMAFDDLKAKKIYCFIRQPRLPSPWDFSSCVYDADIIEDARAELLRIIEATQKEDAPRKPSPDCCSLCKARGTPMCPESIEYERTIRRAKVLLMRPEQLESYAPEMALMSRQINAWQQRVRQCLTFYPESMKTLTLAPQTHTHAIPDLLAVYEKLLAEGKYGPDYAEGLKAFCKDCCTASLPKLADAIAKRDNTNAEDSTDYLFTTLGQRYEFEPDEPGALIISKPKERSIRKKQLKV